MTSAAKTKGDAAEREAAALLSSLLDRPVRRALGAGRLDDQGDLDGIHNHVVQVANWSDTLRACREKPHGAERQRLNASAQHAATMVRFRRVRDPRDRWRIVLTPEQWAQLVIAAESCTKS